MELSDDLIKYRLVRLLISSWLFPLLATVVLEAPAPSNFVVTVLLSLGLFAGAKLLYIMLFDRDEFIQKALMAVAFLGMLGFVVNSILLIFLILKN